jgi:hypothetical protein
MIPIRVIVTVTGNRLLVTMTIGCRSTVALKNCSNQNTPHLKLLRLSFFRNSITTYCEYFCVVTCNSYYAPHASSPLHDSATSGTRPLIQVECRCMQPIKSTYLFIKGAENVVPVHSVHVGSRSCRLPYKCNPYAIRTKQVSSRSCLFRFK